MTGIGDAMPGQTDSKRLHNVPGGVTQDPQAKGSTRYTEHKATTSDFVKGASDGPGVDQNTPGMEELSTQQARDKVEQKQ